MRARRDPGAAAAADALVSATQPRGAETLDKVVYEAAACGVPVIASNTALDEFLDGLPVELRFRAAIRPSLAALLASPRPARRLARDTGAGSAAASSTGHSVESWADAVAKIVAAQTRE